MAAPQYASKLEIDWRYLFILALPVSVLIGSEFILGNFGDINVMLGDVALVDRPELVELSARYRFLAAYFFFLAVSITLTAVFGFELAGKHTRRSIALTLLAVVIVIAITLIFNTIEPAWMVSFEAYELLGAELYETGLGLARVAGCEAGAGFAQMCDGKGGFFAMSYLLDKINILTSFSAVAVITGMVLALSKSHPPDLSSPTGLHEEARQLQAAQDGTRRYLYASGVLLTTGTALGLAWMSWPNGLIADDAIRADHKGLIDAVSLFRGVSYTVLILSYYMPVSLVLMMRIDRFHKAVEREWGHLDETPRLAEKVKGFDINRIASLDALKAIIAIVSPILASAAGGLVSIAQFGG